MKIDNDLQIDLSWLKRLSKVLSQPHTLEDELFKNNWYPISYVSRVEKDPIESIDDFMERLMLDKYDQLKEYCIELMPLRKDILEESFKLFEAENFIACIPLFLIQTDGIARDYGFRNMFSGNADPKKPKFKIRGNSKLIPYLSNFAHQNVLRDKFFSALNSKKFISEKSYEELLITKRTESSTTEENFSLNRHGILHGLIEYQGYASKLNALRAMCFMVYTLNLCEQFKFAEENGI